MTKRKFSMDKEDKKRIRENIRKSLLGEGAFSGMYSPVPNQGCV